MYDKGVNLIFLKEHYIDTEIYSNNLKDKIELIGTDEDEIFKGAELTAVFGGIKLDLRNAVFESDTAINACCIFGGADILLPDNVNIKVNSNSLFGGIDNKKHQNSKDNVHTVYLNGTCIFGGVDVK